jgi:hypothetical protein
MRKITIHVPSTFIADHDIPSIPYFQAVGYLTWWGQQRYPEVDIMPDGKTGDMIAYYRDDTGEVRYVIGAIYDRSNEKYSFHS